MNMFIVNAIITHFSALWFKCGVTPTVDKAQCKANDYVMMQYYICLHGMT